MTSSYSPFGDYLGCDFIVFVKLTITDMCIFMTSEMLLKFLCYSFPLHIPFDL